METPNLLAEYRKARLKVFADVYANSKPDKEFEDWLGEERIKDFYYLVAVETFMQGIKKHSNFHLGMVVGGLVATVGFLLVLVFAFN